VTKIDKAALREALLEQRRALDTGLRAQLSARVASHVCQSDTFVASSVIAAYMPFGNEVDCLPIVETAWDQGKTVALPVIERTGAMRFFRYTRTTSLQKNFFGIDEPAGHGDPPLPAAQIDLVLLPLVGFDSRGYRLGMGGGYYDRYFAGRARSNADAHTALLGIAYDFQRITEVPADGWDIPLDGIVTETGLHLFPQRRKIPLSKR
jgi:5-formyltetrahydrofolate cyclo-ligase